MAQRFERWTKKKIRLQLQILRGEVAPTICLKNATYLNSVRKKWLQANIWIYEDRIIYVGKEMPLKADTTEIIDCSDQFLVPGYIEHHAHPFQLYNPHTLAEYASVLGTTTLINDNMVWFLNTDKKKALTLIEDLDKLPTSMFWWCRYDAQTELLEEESIFSYSNMKEWLEHPLVVQGGELTAWPKVLNGDDSMLHWMQETKKLSKPIEGHLPGASERTLTQMALLGVSCDHEAMTGEEVLMRLDLGYTTSLRNSSIRPDLSKLFDELLELGLDDFSRLMMTTDGSTPSFYEQGFMEVLISIAIDKGISEVDAYAMATYNVARHYRMDDCIGMIAPGRIAHINILEKKTNPRPISVLAKGMWVKKDGVDCYPAINFPWNDYGIAPLSLDWELTSNDMHFSMPLGVEMVNAVILKPYRISFDVTQDEIAAESDESFFMMIDKNGRWIINTVVKRFAKALSGFACSYSNTGDIIIIGKNKNDMLLAFQELKKQQGGIVLIENGEVIISIKLDLYGLMSTKKMEIIIEEEKQLVNALKKRGYPFEDPIYSLLFFASTHLPYVRVTQRGIFDVKKKTVLFPSIMR
ncbi:adenine deaminase C-terminal domain-containing protein [Anaerobacillus isosaccharinicus]|uniref:adenine deaminase n=1 Tax=Anaerobacillus isosaccharinicus TaxID=1532552 RepID=A0A7S7RDB7_9BACI|nr:adenine deaminase C-terminal domain-containing protein [Anaerobacillus isosaccharinicus]MBA5588764.1 adenine deaminase [Anaerobacillus isosaccharinicus]QOY37836.1 adenine deaminase [Anaerobacillus isosaccharinicus]